MKRTDIDMDMDFKKLKNFKDIPARKCGVWINRPELHAMTTIEFAKKTGFPIRLIRRYCREGRITYWQNGKKQFLLDYDDAVREIKKLRVSHQQKVSHSRIEDDSQAGKTKRDKQQLFLDAMDQFL